MSPLLAQSGHSVSTSQCPLLGVKRTQHDFSVHPQKRAPEGLSLPRLYSQRCRDCIPSPPYSEVRRFISRKQVKMKLASGSPSGLVGGSTGIFGNAVLAPPMAAPSATADRARRAKFPPCGSILIRAAQTRRQRPQPSHPRSQGAGKRRFVIAESAEG
jgi:hypothetical protein